MSEEEYLTICDGCGVEITWAPFLVKRPGMGVQAQVQKPLRFCCETCSQGLPCNCADRMELDDERRGYNPGDAIPGL